MAMNATANKHQPVRTCVVCRKRFPKEELERYVCPDATQKLEMDGPISDPHKNMSGRGFYVCVQARCREVFPKKIKGLMRKRKGDC